MVYTPLPNGKLTSYSDPLPKLQNWFQGGFAAAGNGALWSKVAEGEGREKLELGRKREAEGKMKGTERGIAP